MNIFQQRIKLAAKKAVDEFHDENYKSPFYKFLIKKNISIKVAKKILEHYQDCSKEILDAVTKSDEQAVQAYKHLSKKQLDSLTNMYHTLQEDTKKFIEERNKYKVVKKRKKKTINNDETTIKKE